MAFMRLEAFSGLCFFMGLVIVLANLLPYLFTHLGSSNLAGSLQQRMIPITAGACNSPSSTRDRPHHRGLHVPLSSAGLLASHRINMCKGCEMGLLFIILIRED